jgi:hypothetical protein
MNNLYPFRDALMLTPDLFRASWRDAQTAATKTLMYRQPSTDAKQVFGLVVREAYFDVIAITGAVLLHWFATKQQPSSLTSRIAILVLNREAMPDSGNTLLDPQTAAKSIFRLIFDLLIREALTFQFEDNKYSAVLDRLISVLNETATPRMIPGRIYGGFSLDGFQTLTPEFLAIMAANLPTTGDGGVSELFQRLLSDYPALQNARALRDFEDQFGRYSSALDGEPDERFTSTVKCFVENPDLPLLRNQLKGIFDSVVDAIIENRRRKIREAPLDEARVKTVRETVEKGLLAIMRPSGVFSPTSVGRTDRVLPARESTFGVMDRGSFTKPEMSAITFDELPRFFVQFADDFFRNILWFELKQRPKLVEAFEPEKGPASLLDRVQQVVGGKQLGDKLVLLVPYKTFGNAIYMTASGYPTAGLEGYGITHEADVESGAGCTYVGTLSGIRIYSWQMQDAAILFSGDILKTIRFGCVRNIDAVFDFELFDTGDPMKSLVRMWLAPEFDWEDREVVVFEFPKPIEDVGTDADNSVA